MPERTNDEWLIALHDPNQMDDALADLRRVLLRGLRGALGSRSNVGESDLDDFAQDALLKILHASDTFRGESRFTTWAQKIAVRVALTELRRRRWRDTSLDEMIDGATAEDGRGEFIPAFLADSSAGPEQQAVQNSMLATVRRVVNEGLTERQREALVAVRIHGVPLEEVARRMDTNRNSLYKLLHDARKRLQQELVDQGLSVDEILEAFDK